MNHVVELKGGGAVSLIKHNTKNDVWGSEDKLQSFLTFGT